MNLLRLCGQHTKVANKQYLLKQSPIDKVRLTNGVKVLKNG